MSVILIAIALIIETVLSDQLKWDPSNGQAAAWHVESKERVQPGESGDLSDE